MCDFYSFASWPMIAAPGPAITFVFQQQREETGEGQLAPLRRTQLRSHTQHPTYISNFAAPGPPRARAGMRPCLPVPPAQPWAPRSAMSTDGATRGAQGPSHEGWSGPGPAAVSPTGLSRAVLGRGWWSTLGRPGLCSEGSGPRATSHHSEKEPLQAFLRTFIAGT